VRLSRVRESLLLVGALALGAVLLVQSARTFQALEQDRAVYLRSRLGALAERLEAAPDILPDEPGLLGFALLDRSSDPSPLDAVWEGQELFRTENVTVQGEAAVRAWIPVHAGEGQLRLARLDLASSAADFLAAEARSNLKIAAWAALALLGLAGYTVFTLRRTARLQAAHAKLEHFAQLGRLSAVLAHEIRNPLGTIKGFAQLLDEKAPPDDRALLAPILSETTRLEALVNDLLLYGRPPHVQPRAIRWAEVEAGLRQHMDRLLAGSAVHFQAQSPDLELHTDAALLQQALLNLLRNAAEALDGSGEVRLQAETDGGDVRITVADDGPGLTAEARGSLFQPFFTTKVSGTGLGLAITRKLILSLGGTLSLDSPARGGTLATIVLPRRDSHGTHSAG
jgi:two-component system, NtrC family, sensor histidine kinase HydH